MTAYCVKVDLIKQFNRYFRRFWDKLISNTERNRIRDNLLLIVYLFELLWHDPRLTQDLFTDLLHELVGLRRRFVVVDHETKLLKVGMLLHLVDKSVDQNV